MFSLIWACGCTLVLSFSKHVNYNTKINVAVTRCLLRANWSNTLDKVQQADSVYHHNFCLKNNALLSRCESISIFYIYSFIDGYKAFWEYPPSALMLLDFSKHILHPTSTHFIVVLFCFVFNPVYSISVSARAWEYGHPLEHGQPTRGHTLKNFDSLLPISHQLWLCS